MLIKLTPDRLYLVSDYFILPGLPFDRSSLEDDGLIVLVDGNGGDLTDVQIRSPVVHFDGMRNVLFL